VDDAEHWSEIGARIRAAREAGGMSVRELGRRIGVSPSHISQVERGLGSFSVSALYSVASQLQISLDSLFEIPAATAGRRDPDAVPSPLDGTLVQRGADRPVITLNRGLRWERLTVESESEAEFLEVVYAAGPSEPEPGFNRHDGIEYGVVISGALSVQVGFEATVLYPGDSIRLDSSQPHRYWNAGTVPVRAIWFESRASRLPDEPPRVPSH
jgi:transcriptional regulator with XRE-family HTH domain